MRLLKHLTLALVATVVAIVIATTAWAEEIELKFGHVGAPGSLFEASANEFAKRANEKLAGKAKVVTFGSSQLGKDKELLQKLKLGTVDFALPSTVMSTVSDEFGLFEMPYLVKDRDHMGRIEKEIFWEKIAPAAEAKGYKILAVWENGFRHITNNKRPITVPADLQGIKLRTPKGAWRVKMFQSYGANPTPMALSEVFTALQTGVIDGQENPFAQIYSSKFQEVQKYLSLTGHVYTPAYITVGIEKWNSLPPDVRQILEETARDTQAYVYETAAAMETDLLGKLKASGMEVNEADKAAFIAASKGIYDEFATTVPGGKEMVDKAISLGGSS
jgi:tripartite ATP-independent transporter DctP family solute receptor